ncbi:MAG: hypothetical protein ACI8TA_002441 [Cyclobacteriaceae bacterium]|jgi:hypothetical protein
MKKHILYFLTICLLASCSCDTYYTANNKNIQQFHNAQDEQTAKYLLELNDDILLISSIACLAKQRINSEDLTEAASKLEKIMNKLKREVRVESIKNHVYLSNVLSKQNDHLYASYHNMSSSELENAFKEITETSLANLLKKTDGYIADGQNPKIQKFSVGVKTQVASALENYS